VLGKVLWGWGAHQRLEMMRKVCWRLVEHSDSWGSFSNKTCKPPEEG
jgi:hypothetical protein